jgi:hypothetical protein
MPSAPRTSAEDLWPGFTYSCRGLLHQAQLGPDVQDLEGRVDLADQAQLTLRRLALPLVLVPDTPHDRLLHMQSACL